MSELISLREFARRLNVGEKTIRDGVKLGKISKGVVNGKIDYEIALQEAVDIGLGHKSLINKGVEPKHPKEPKQPKQEYRELTEDDPIAGLGPETTIVTATRAEKIFKAQLACLEVEAKAGTLVNKSEVYSQLFEFGTQIRSEFEAMPGRIASKLLLFKNASSLSEYLAKEIRDSLSKLVDNLSERKIT